MKRYQGLLIFIGVFLTVAAGVFIPFHQYWFALGALIAGIILFFAVFLWLHTINNEQRLVFSGNRCLTSDDDSA